MRRARGALPPGVWLEAPGQAGDGGAFERLFDRHRGQQAGKPQRQHRLARARRARHEHAVATGCGNLQRAFGCGLAFDVGHVGAATRHGHGGGVQGCPAVVGDVGVAVSRAARRQKGTHHVQQMARAHHPCRRHQRGFFGAARGQHQLCGDLLRLQRQAGGQRPAHGPQLARQREFARKLIPRQLAGIDLPAGRQNAQRDGQIETA